MVGRNTAVDTTGAAIRRSRARAPSAREATLRRGRAVGRNPEGLAAGASLDGRPGHAAIASRGTHVAAVTPLQRNCRAACISRTVVGANWHAAAAGGEMDYDDAVQT